MCVHVCVCVHVCGRDCLCVSIFVCVCMHTCFPTDEKVLVPQSGDRLAGKSFAGNSRAEIACPCFHKYA